MSVEATADALAALLDARDAAPAHVVGYSLGARVALRLAVAHPDVVDRLVLESPSAGLPTEAERAARRAADEALAARIEARRHRALRRRVGAQPGVRTGASLEPDRAAQVREMRLGNDPGGPRGEPASRGPGRDGAAVRPPARPSPPRRS